MYLPDDWAADEERRELAGIPDDVMFATKPELAGRLLQDAHDLGIRVDFVAGDEVYGGLGLRKGIRERGTGYVLAVRSNYQVTVPSGRRLTVKNAASLVKPGMWQRMRASWHRWSAISLLAAACLAIAAACPRARDASADILELIPVTVPELLRQLRGTVIPGPCRNKAHLDAWTLWRRRHQYRAQQAHQRWHAYADKVPQAA